MFQKTTERGQALILIALAAIGLFAFSALAIDGSRAYSDKRHAQNAADTAALNAALKYIREPIAANKFAAAHNGATAIAQANGYVDDGSNIIVDIDRCDEVVDKYDRQGQISTGTPLKFKGDNIACEGLPATATTADKAEYIRVRIYSRIPTTFGRVLGREMVESAVEATARVQTGTSTSGGGLFDGAGMVTTKGGNYDQCFLLNGEGDITVHGAGISVNCSHAQAVFLNAKSKLTMDKNGQVIGCYFGNSGYYTSPIDCWQNNRVSKTINATNFASIPTKEPTPTCSGTGGVSPSSTGTYDRNGTSITVKTGKVILTQGNFGDINVEANATEVVFSPGTYCISGSVNTSDPLTGSGGTVKIVQPTGSINLNSGGGMNFSDLELYSSSGSNLTLNSGVPVNATRFRYFSDGNGGVVINSGASLTSDDAYIYLKKGNITWNGNATIDLEAPKTGAYAGLLLHKPWGASTPSTQIDFNAGSNINMVGTFLAPSSPIVYNSQVDFALHSQIIGYTFVTNSKANIDIWYDASKNYGGSPATDPTIQLTR